ncbi:MAG TPA: PIN domain-containing protein [Longimicrobium sp.]|nr:PIN domain-containing protein [Longimicrobium sp.]
MTAGAEPVVVDTNILFSALLREDTAFSTEMFESPREFFICETTLMELFRHREKLIRLSRMNAPALVQMYHLLLKCLTVYKENHIPDECWTRARELCAGLDPDDASQVAVALALGGLLWTGDNVLKTGLRARGFDRFFSF